VTTNDDFVERLAARLDDHAERRGALGVGAADDAGSGTVTALIDELRTASTWSAPPAGLRDSILSAVRAEAEATTVAEPAPAPVVQRPARRQPWWRTAHTGRLRLWVAIPAAAMVAAVFTAGVLAVDRSLQPDPRQREVYTVAGTSLAPQAVVTASVADTPSGFSIWLRLRGLPPAAEGSYYAAWLVGPRGTVALGSFHERQAGDRVELWSGVDPKDYPTFLITLQSEGGPPGPSALVVARGPLNR
jgi:hypothetical protein